MMRHYAVRIKFQDGRYFHVRYLVKAVNSHEAIKAALEIFQERESTRFIRRISVRLLDAVVNG